MSRAGGGVNAPAEHSSSHAKATHEANSLGRGGPAPLPRTTPAEVWRDRALILRHRIENVLHLHQPPRRGGKTGISRPVCTECGFPWPCQTYQLLDPVKET